MTLKDKMLAVALVMAVAVMFASAISLVNVRYEMRTLQAELAKLEEEERKIRYEAWRLEIEHSTFSDLREVHANATATGMRFPSAEEETIVLIREDKR